MKYYKLEYNSLNINETGTQFQCTSVEEIGDMYDIVIPNEGKIINDFKLPIPKLDKNAKQTTLLNVGPINYGFLVLKNYFIDFLNNFGITEFQKWEIKVKHNNIYIHDYCLLHYNVSMQRSLIDFKNSSFYLGKFSDYLYVGKELKTNNYDDYLSVIDLLKVNEDNFLKCKKIVLKLNDVNIDMFKLWIDPFGGYYVSEKLRDAIEKERFTGMVFKEIEKVSDKIEIQSK